MIPLDIRLYTWVDVEDVLLRINPDEWPYWLVSARAYWDELSMEIRPGTQEEAKEWLREVFHPRYRQSNSEEIPDCFIILESVKGEETTLPIWFEETEEKAPTARVTPSLSRPGVVFSPPKDVKVPENLRDDFPPVVAFHSFKGGVGRTTHLLALAQALTEEKKRILVVDGDLEAPGISWMLEAILPNPPVCFADFLALAHWDPSSLAAEAVRLVSDRLQSASIDGIYFLPAFRSTTKFNSLEIKPEHLIQGDPNPFLLTDTLAYLGKTLEVDVVLIDLRSGLSELATSLILDPRVYRVFVTTLSEQSVAGTELLLKEIGERSLSAAAENPLPALIFTKVPRERSQDWVAEPEQRLLEVIQPFFGEDQDREPVRIITRFTDNLLVLPRAWEDVRTLLKESGIVGEMHTLLKWLPIDASQPIEEKNLTSERDTLKEKAENLVYAETSKIPDFFATTSLRALASRYQNSLPIAVIVGAKGSGKTYTFLQIVRRKNWEDFAVDAGATEVNAKALIAPILESQNLKEQARNLVAETRENTADALGFALSQNADTIRDRLRDNFSRQLHEGQWREIWLDLMAWAIGFQVKEEGAGQGLIEHLIKEDKQVVFVIDGLEDLFQNLASDKNQQIALRALLQEVPQRLEQQPGRPLGILIFIRRDLVLAAIHQNAAQMMARYQPYALNWSRQEALRLVAWLVGKFKIIKNLDLDKLREMSEEELTKELVPLWGKKLGKDNSKEAFSAKWVLDALSDFNVQIQSRDLVRLLSLAASYSIDDSRWQDRLLAPKAIKGALPGCSSQKIEEISLENKALEALFNQLRDLSTENKKSPFTREDMEKLSSEDLKTLEDNGVIIRDGDDYYMSEIFRWGLGFSQNAGRSKIIALARLARSRLAYSGL